jgi:hypothetical protein
LPKLRQYGFDQACTFLANSKRNAVEEIILSAFRWAGRASADRRNEEAFVLFMISLESLLCGDTNMEALIRLSLRCSRLIGATPQERKEIHKQVKRLYGLRSKIVHNGSLEVTTSDLALMRDYAKRALLTVIGNDMHQMISNKDEFYDWFQDQMLK